jgi:hypothetical protein
MHAITSAIEQFFVQQKQALSKGSETWYTSENRFVHEFVLSLLYAAKANVDSCEAFQLRAVDVNKVYQPPKIRCKCLKDWSKDKYKAILNTWKTATIQYLTKFKEACLSEVNQGGKGKLIINGDFVAAFQSLKASSWNPHCQMPDIDLEILRIIPLQQTIIQPCRQRAISEMKYKRLKDRFWNLFLERLKIFLTKEPQKVAGGEKPLAAIPAVIVKSAEKGSLAMTVPSAATKALQNESNFQNNLNPSDSEKTKEDTVATEFCKSRFHQIWNRPAINFPAINFPSISFVEEADSSLFWHQAPHDPILEEKSSYKNPIARPSATKEPQQFP